MKWIKVWSVLLGCCVLPVGAQTEAAGAKLKVVTTLSTFADLASTIGGEHVDVAFIASPKFNPHFIEPKPSDVLKVKRADLFIHAGLDLELWRGPLLDAAGNTKLFPGGPGELDLSQGIELLEVPGGAVSRAQGDIHIYGNPHYWTDPNNAIIMAKAIAAKLSELDPAHAAIFDERMRAFTRQLGGQMARWQERLRPFQGQELIGYHNEWPYLMRFAGLRTEHFLEPKPGIPPTPQQIEFIQQYVETHHIRAIAQATYFPTQAAEILAKRTGMNVILLCQNVGEVPEASDYLATVEYNVSQLIKGLSQ